MQAQAALLTKMAFRPVSVTSTFHKRLATAMGKQHSKQQKVRHVVTVVDPKRAKEEREKAEEERIRGRESLYKRQVGLVPMTVLHKERLASSAVASIACLF